MWLPLNHSFSQTGGPDVAAIQNIDLVLVVAASRKCHWAHRALRVHKAHWAYRAHRAPLGHRAHWDNFATSGPLDT